MAKRPDDNNSSGKKPVNRSLERKIGRARIVMLLEQIWPRLWLPIGIVALFVIASSWGIWPVLPLAAHILLLVLFCFALLFSFAPVMRLQMADRHAAIRWLEKKSGLPHRPASVIDDELSTTKREIASGLWRVHKKRAVEHVKAMRTGLPRPKTAQFDRYALRVPLILALVATIGLRTDRIAPGLYEAFEFFKTAPLSDLRIDAWVTPPSYTGKPPVMLVNGAKSLNSQINRDQNPARRIEIPEMSELVVRVSGPNAPGTKLVLRQPKNIKSAGNHTSSSKNNPVRVDVKQEGAVRELRARLKQTINARLHLDDRKISNWRFVVTKDHPPAITLTKKPEASPRGSLRLSYRVADDYGVIEAMAHINKTAVYSKSLRDKIGASAFKSPLPSSPSPDNLLLPLGTPPTFSLLLPKGNTKRGTASTYKDLTAHPWAGLEVNMKLVARDEAGKTGKSLVAGFKLPERIFTKPLARAIITQRRRLVERPFEFEKIARNLDLITNVPLNSPSQLIANKSVFLGLRSAYWRLRSASKRQTIRSVVDQLWEIALGIEDGSLSQKERELRSAQDRLMDALSKNAPQKEIARLMKELRQALNKFLQAMAKNQQNADQQQIPGDQPTLSMQELDKMLRDIEDMAKTGARAAAKQMLSQLREMLENLNKAQPKSSQRAQEMRKQLDELGKMIMKQRKLMDETHQKKQQGGERKRGQRQGQRPAAGKRQGQRQGQGQKQGAGAPQGQMPSFQQGRGQGQGSGQGQQGQRGEGSGNQQQRAGASNLQQRQGQLLDGLNDLMDQMGRMGMRVPQDLMRAGSNMGKAESQLGRQQLNSAGRQQGKALQNLRKGATELVEQMMRNNQGQSSQGGRQKRDPLGRAQRSSGPEFGDNVKVPRQFNTQRARDILEELRRRLGQSTRPPSELDYLERLIEQF